MSRTHRGVTPDEITGAYVHDVLSRGKNFGHPANRMGIFPIADRSGLLFSAPLAWGDDGTAQTIAVLRGLVDDAWKDPFVNRTAIEIIRNAGAQPHDSQAQIAAIYDYARSFYFVNDPITKEALRPTRELLQLKAGDCDDINANVLPALLGSIGFETRLVTVASDARMPDYFSHVYCEVFIDGEWYPLDAARPGAVIGVAPESFFRRQWWSLTDDSHEDYPGGADGTMSGYHPQTLRGLAGVTSDVAAILTDASGALKSVGGQTVRPVVGPAIGPGGAAMSVPAQTSFFSTSTGELLFLAAVIGGILWLASE
jgi:Transglutaminase-like superfamily